jgi:Universal stress protein family
MVAVLAAAWHFAERLNAPLLVIHGGAPDAQKEAEFRDVMFQLEMPRETRIVWNEGEPAGAIVTAAEKEGVDLLIAGALEGEDVASRSFLGAVAQPLAKLARCSVLLLTHPQIGPNPFRRIVVITEGRRALRASRWAWWNPPVSVSLSGQFLTTAAAQRVGACAGRPPRQGRKALQCAMAVPEVGCEPFLNKNTSGTSTALASANKRNRSTSLRLVFPWPGDEATVVLCSCGHLGLFITVRW